mgnify:CR=1 FL=1
MAWDALRQRSLLRFKGTLINKFAGDYRWTADTLDHDIALAMTSEKFEAAMRRLRERARRRAVARHTAALSRQALLAWPRACHHAAGRRRAPLTAKAD